MIHLDLRPDSPELPSGEHAVRHLVLRLTADPTPRETALPPLDLALVIDRSGSMARGRLDAAKRAAAGVVRGLREIDRLTLVTFGTDVRVHHDAEPMTGTGRERVLTSLAGLHAGECTNLSGGYQTGGHLLLAAGDDISRRRHLLLLSDGHANRGLTDPRELGLAAAALQEQGVTTSCVGIGDGYSTTQLAALAERGGGELHDAETPEEIVEVVLGELDHLGDVVAESLELTIDLPPGVEGRDLSGRDALREGDTLRCPLGQLNGGASRTVVVRLEVPPRELGEQVELTTSLTWRISGRPEEAARLARRVCLTPVLVAEARVSLDDARSVLRQWESGLVRQVVALNRDHDYAAVLALGSGEGRELMEYARLHHETRESARRIERLLHHMAHPRGERSRKNLYTLAQKSAKGVRDHRQGRGENWHELLDR